jgi:hypothetical protein
VFESSVAQAIALSSAVSEQLSVDACARTFNAFLMALLFRLSDRRLIWVGNLAVSVWN